MSSRTCIESVKQGLGSDTFTGQYRGARLDVGGHDLAIEFGMKLHPPAALAEVQAVVGIMIGPGDDARPGRGFEHDFNMGELKALDRMAGAEQGIIGVQDVDIAGAHATAARVRSYLATQGMGDQLMAVADAQQGSVQGMEVPQPGSGALGPVGPMRNHGRRAGHQGRGYHVR